MAFAYTTAVTGAGTVSCTGTTTVTGTGTSFATLTGVAATSTQARKGGTITVGGVTKKIVDIISATQLITDTAFGTFTGSAFTVQTGVAQTGTDTMGLSLGSATGFTITNRADLQRTFDIQGLDLTIRGTLTVQAFSSQLRNDGSCNNTFKVIGSASGGEIIFMGTKTASNNSPFPYAGFDWLGTNGLKIMSLEGTATYPGKFTLNNACVRFGADWLTTYAGQYSAVTTIGDVCWILCAKGTGTSQARLRQDNTTASINFTATKTFLGVWLNMGVAQTSLKGYTPIDTDGPEVNSLPVAVASRIPIENYNTTYVTPAYYAGSQITLYAGSWVRLKNNLKGTNIAWQSQSPTNRNVLEFSKQITAKAQDSVGNILNDGFMYYQPVGSNVAGIRAKGGTTDITFNLTQQSIQFSAGSATSEFVYAWGYANTVALFSAYSYFCTGTTRGSETHTVYSSRYGYDKVALSVALNGNGEVVSTFVHASLPTSDKVIATAAAITGITFDFGTKNMTISGNLTYQQIYDAYQYALNLTANLQTLDNCLTVNNTSNYVGWTITINTGITVSAGTGNFNKLQAQTITLNGTAQITGVYTTSAGTSTTWQFQGITVGSSIIVYDASKTTKYFQQEVTTAGTYNYYIPPGVSGTYYFAVEQYGKKREEGSFAANTGGILYYTPLYAEDVGISQTTKATVAAYTSIENLDKFYDRVAYFRLSEVGIKLGQIATRSGTAVDIGNFSLVVNQSAGAVLTSTSSLITIKSTSFANGTKFTLITATPPKTVTANTTEVITASIEDANGDSSVTIQGGSGNFTLWKITNATAEADYATGTNLGTVGNVTFRFIHADGYKIVIVDNVTGYRIPVSMSKGIYTKGLFFGDQVQLAQSAEVTQINTKVDVMQLDVTKIIKKENIIIGLTA